MGVDVRPLPYPCGSLAMSSDGASRTIVCYGDSNTWGFDPATAGRFPRKERWTGVLQALLSDEKHKADDFYVVEEGLNARTTVFDDPVGPAFGMYSCNGRKALPPILHSHKPVDLVVLALGVNDLKRHFAVSPGQIALAVKSLVKDIQAHSIGPDNAEGVPVIVCGPPRCSETSTCLAWGFEGCGSRSIALTKELDAMCKEEGLPFIDFGVVGKVSGIDGIHFDKESQSSLARAVYEKVVAQFESELA